MFLRSAMFPTAGSRKVTRALFSRNAIASTTGTAITSVGSAIITLSGAMTATTLKSFLSVSGASGEMTHLTIRTADATARTIRTVLTIDGTAYDFTTASISSSGVGVLLAGATTSTSTVAIPSIKWNSTFTIQIASSVSETDKLTIEWAYNTEA
jgi:hypothetical protein